MARREIPLSKQAEGVVLLVVDVQNHTVEPRVGAGTHDECRADDTSPYFISALDLVVKNIAKLQAGFRGSRYGEVVFTTIESLTSDGRDRGLDYKISNIMVPRGSWGAKVVAPLAPVGDEIVIPKSSSSPFASTNIAYILRNLGCKQIVVVGALTDQCVDSTVRDACDEGFLVTVVTDACIARTLERHQTSLSNSSGYARQTTTDRLLEELRLAEDSTATQDLRTSPIESSAVPVETDAAGSPLFLRSFNDDTPAPPPGGAPPVSQVGSAGVVPLDREEGYVRFEITDLNGRSLSKLVPARHRGDSVYLYSGALGVAPNASVKVIPKEVEAAGFPNWKLTPYWGTERVLPWAAAGRPGTVIRRVLCEQERRDFSIIPGFSSGAPTSAAPSAAEPNPVVPRFLCRKMLAALAAHGGRGLLLLSASELEFTLAHKPAALPTAATEEAATEEAAAGAEEADKEATEREVTASKDPREDPILRTVSGDGWAPHFAGVDICATLQATKSQDFCLAVEQGMRAVGVDVRTMNPEYGAGQLEITFAPDFGVASADAAVTFRTGVKELAQQRGLLATFMTRPFGAKGLGNGGHCNFSLWEPEAGGHEGLMNAFYGGAGVLSKTAFHFLAGVLKHVAGLEAIMAPTPVCYIRHGNWAPAVANWGIEDRRACVRAKPGSSPRSCYLEFRLPSASANPYLVHAGLIAAGLDGLSCELEPPPQGQRSRAEGALEVPTTLPDALTALEADAVLTEALGADFVRWFCGLKRAEVAALKGRLEHDLGVGTAQSRRDFLDACVGAHLLSRAELAAAREERGLGPGVPYPEPRPRVERAVTAAWQDLYMEYV